MRLTPSSCDSGHLSFQNDRQNLLRNLIAATALQAVACGQISQPATPVHSAPATSLVARSQAAANPLQQTPGPESSASQNLHSEASQSAEPITPAAPQVIPLTVAATPSNKPWAGVPSKCVYTGEVLTHDLSSTPHRILLENICLQKRMEVGRLVKNSYEGEHLWVDQDSRGRYPIPFFDSYLAETSGGRLIFVTKDKGNEVALALEANGQKPSFARLLDYYNVRAFATQK